MKRESDLVQATSEAFGEVFVLEQARATVANKLASAKAKEVASQVAALYALDCVRRELAWFLCEGLLGRDQAGEVQARIEDLCRDLVPSVPSLLNAFEIPALLVDTTPIAGDWVKFYER